MLNERQDPKYLVQHHPDGKRRAHDVQGIETTSCKNFYPVTQKHSLSEVDFVPLLGFGGGSATVNTTDTS